MEFSFPMEELTMLSCEMKMKLIVEGSVCSYLNMEFCFGLINKEPGYAPLRCRGEIRRRRDEPMSLRKCMTFLDNTEIETDEQFKVTHTSKSNWTWQKK